MDSVRIKVLVQIGVKDMSIGHQTSNNKFKIYVRTTVFEDTWILLARITDSNDQHSGLVSMKHTVLDPRLNLLILPFRLGQ